MGLRSCHLFFRPLCQSPYDRDLAAQNVCWHENLLAELTSIVQFGVNMLVFTNPGSVQAENNVPGVRGYYVPK